MHTLVIYSYLLIPLIFFLTRSKIKDWDTLVISLYGIVFFILLFFYYDTPKDIRKYYQAFYTFVEYSFFTLIFWRHFRNKFFRYFIVSASILFVLFQIFYVTSASFSRLDSIPIGIETILIFLYIFYFFFQFSKQAKDSFIYNHYCFWISVGILIYLGGSFFFYLLIAHLDVSEMERFGNLTYIAEIIKNIFFATSILIYKKYSKINASKKPENIPNLDMI